MNIYIKNFIYYSNVEKIGIREKLKEYLQDLGEIILKLNPEMKEIIGECSPLVPLEPEREHHRFITFSSQFFLKLDELENGLVIFLDDLQWLDERSFELLNQIAFNISKYPVLIIGTYRDNEITKEHSLVLFKDTIGKKQYHLVEISLESFNQSKMDQFIVNLLFDTEENTKEISSFVLQKSKGNPFFALEILKQMITEKAIYQENNRWNIDREVFYKMEIFSNIVDILLKRIYLLEEKEITILSYAAVIGRKFDIELLFELGKTSSQLSIEGNKEILKIVEKAKELQLLEEDLQIRGKILFVHDRIREAFYQKIRNEKRKVLHNTIGYTIEEINKNDIDGVTFDLAHHFVEADNIDKSIQYTFPASMKAKENFANEEAIKYLMITKELLEKKGMEKSDLWIKCNQSIGKIYLIIGKNNETIELYEKLLPMLDDKINKAKAYVQIGNAYFKIWDYKNCELYIKMGFDLIGERLPLKRREVILSIIKEFIIHIIHNLFPNIFIRKKENKKNVNKYKLMLSFNYSLIQIYMFLDILKFIRINLRSLNISESKIGISKELGIFLSAYGGILVMISLFNGAMKYHQKSLKINKEFNDLWGIGYIYQLIGVVILWKGEYKESINYLTKSIEIMKRVGDIKEIILGIHNLRYAYLYLGYFDNAIKTNNEYFELAKSSNDNFGIISSILGNTTILYGKGDLIEAEKWLLELQLIDEKYKISLLFFEEYFYFGLIALEKNEVNKSIDYFEKSKDIYENNNLMEQFTCYIYSFLADAYLIKYENLFKGFKQKKQILKKIKKYSVLGIKKTKSWITHYSNSLRIYAKYNSIINKAKKAEKYFIMSIDIANRIQKKYDIAKGYFKYGNFLNNIHKKDQAFENWKKAYAVFKEIDSNLYIKKIKILLKIEDEKESSFQEFVKRLKNEQVSSNLLKLSQDIISSEDINQLLGEIMDVVLEMTGAGRGCIIIRDEQTNDLEILASKSMDQKEISFENFSLNIVYEALNTGETVLNIDAMNDEKYSQYQSIIQYGIKSILCFPIIYKGETRGDCYLDNQLSGVDFSQENIEKLNLIMTQIILSTENISLRKKYRKIIINEKYLSSKCKEFGLTKRENEILLLVIKGFN